MGGDEAMQFWKSRGNNFRCTLIAEPIPYFCTWEAETVFSSKFKFSNSYEIFFSPLEFILFSDNHLFSCRMLLV